MVPFISFLVAFLLLLQQAWFAASHAEVCKTSTETRLVLAGTTVSDQGGFKSSLDSIYSTPHVTATVFVWSSMETWTYSGSSGSFMAYGIYDSAALTSAGYSITSETAVMTTCPEPEASTTSTCTPNGDRSDCDGVPSPTTPPSAEDTGKLSSAGVSATCSPHIDHWHCPDGVLAPTTPPSPEQLGESTVAASATCSPHIDHWHCPDGVTAPATPPGPSDFGSATPTADATHHDGSSIPTASPTPTGAAAHVVVAGPIFGCTLLSLVIFFFLL